MTLLSDTFQSAGRLVARWKHPILVSHARPDGDALGSLIAMRSVLRALGAQPTALRFDPIPHKYEFLTADDPLTLFDDGRAMNEHGTPTATRESASNPFQSADGVLVVDTCSYTQLDPVADALREIRQSSSCPIVVVDHHLTRDELANHYLVDESACATCAILYEWAQSCRWALDSAALRALFIGIATDTGWFRFSNTDPRALRIAADLLERGVLGHALFEFLFQQESPARVRLFGAALDEMQLLDEDRIAVLTVTRDLFRRCKADPADTEDLINEPLRIGSVEISVLLAETENDVVKTSFRSKGCVDVAALAARFGGGGHARAAGARLQGTIASVRDRIIKTVSNDLHERSS